MIDGYEKLPNGIIKQTKIFNKKAVYDTDYIHTYEEFGELGLRMSYLRLGNIIGAITLVDDKVLDVGYGSGDFLKVLEHINVDAYGTDISGYPIPANANFIEWDNVFKERFKVITFFDSLEHFEDISFVRNLNCEYVVISLPECHQHVMGDEWFENWKHRKPDEHLWHFSRQSLKKFMQEQGYYCVTYNNVEDVVRKPNDKLPNIITGIFKKIL